jgi:shikimate kinase
MGSGKSSVGLALAKKLKRNLVDIDKLIETKAGKSISRIFKEDGEPAFRETEFGVISEVSRVGDQVIACGGGAILNPNNIKNLKQNAVVIYLQASENTIKKRVSGTRGTRPLLAGTSGLDRIERLMTSRQPLYEAAADIKVDTSKLGIDAAAEEIVNSLREYESFSF